MVRKDYKTRQDIQSIQPTLEKKKNNKLWPLGVCNPGLELLLRPPPIVLEERK